MILPFLNGNEALNARLAHVLESGTLSHAYIVYGDNPEERRKLGMILASAHVCSSEGGRPCTLCKDCRKALRGIHPDIKSVLREKDKRSYGIDIIREMVRDASVLPNEAEKKVYIIPDGEFLTPGCQNAALKILEEPPAYAAFIILAESPGAFLETFRSRCIELFMGADTTDKTCQSGFSEAFIKAFRLRDPLETVSAALMLEKCERGELIGELRELREAFVKELRSSPALGETYIAAAGLVARLLEMADANVSAGSIAGVLSAGCNMLLK